ncbi:hypothetical protein [Microbacterium sp. lyk4-40-TSB-66]|uniref:hypothetical protein n=1 Tax=Microbacterium sp. lyk4-40-TSB-66 TaxID=3040294 RepID=UPI00254BA34C|nr:hypothetical protein [Microbacterium sp. lyk4-40-TSB-66]
MSDYVVHFTETAGSLLSILSEGRVRESGPYGWAFRDATARSMHMSACMSEIPIDNVDRLVRQHGQFGIAFRREFVSGAGGHRIWYLDDTNGLQRHLYQAFRPLYSSDPDRLADLWRLSPFIDRVTPGRDFTWEREWRVPGGLAFAPADVEFLMVPKRGGSSVLQNPASGLPLLSAEATEFWSDAFSALGGPEDKWVDEFLTDFTDPVNHLTWDGEDQDYYWMWEKWSTESAVDLLFGGRLRYEALQSLAERLNGIAPDWIRVSDMAADPE